MIHATTEWEQKAVVGRIVCVTEELIPVENLSGWQESALEDRQGREGQEGVVTDYSNSHGLCFEVRFEDGATAWFEPAELTRLDKYPIERKFTLLRQCFFDPSLYEQRDEVWLQLGPTPENGFSPRKLVSSEPTGRKFKVTRKVSPEAMEDAPELFGPKDHEVVRYMDPSFAIVTMLKQVEGDSVDGVIEDQPLAKSLEALQIEVGQEQTSEEVARNHPESS
jgi:hypothetical protein